MSDLSTQTQNGLLIEHLLIQMQGWSRSYQLSVSAGDKLAISGVSGLGKTSLLMAIAGLCPSAEGRILWNGQRIDLLEPEQRPVAMLFQNDNLFEHLSVFDNLSLGIDRTEVTNDQLIEAARTLGIETELQKRPPQLSGGQRQRAALLRTLFRPEPIILLDEPFAELDDETRRIAAAWTKTQIEQSGKTLLMVTHQQEDAEFMEMKSLKL